MSPDGKCLVIQVTFHRCIFATSIVEYSPFLLLLSNHCSRTPSLRKSASTPTLSKLSTNIYERHREVSRTEEPNVLLPDATSMSGKAISNQIEAWPDLLLVGVRRLVTMKRKTRKNIPLWINCDSVPHAFFSLYILLHFRFGGNCSNNFSTYI